jgi:hypothetical protein
MINIVALLLVILNTAIYIGPTEATILDLALQGDTNAMDKVVSLLPILRQHLGFSLILNLIMLILPLFHLNDLDIIPRIHNDEIKSKMD